MAQNLVQTYKDALNYASVNYKSLGPFNAVCFQCGVLHYFLWGKNTFHQFLDPDEAAKEHLTQSLDHVIFRNPVGFLEEILRDTN